MSSPGSVCHVCGQGSTELRPYGVDGAALCFPCLKSSPEREAEAKRQFDKALRAAGSRMVVVGAQSGPRAATYAEAVMVEDVLRDADATLPAAQPSAGER